MMIKICSRCHQEKPLSDFNNGKMYYDGKTPSCKVCIKKYKQKYYLNNKSKVKKYALENKDKINKSQKDYYTKNREKIKEKVRKYQKLRKSKDPIFKLKSNIRTMVNNLLKNRGFTKKSNTFNIVGCSYDEFVSYIEKQFLPWMSWYNYGLYNGEENYGWDIDHIIPMVMAITEEDVIKFNHYTNLRPLCSKINRDIKRDK